MSEYSRLLRAPTVQEVMDAHGQPLPELPGPPQEGKEIVVLGTSVFQSVAPRVYDSHRMLTAWLAANYGTNFWMIPSQERMPFPDAPLFALGTMFRLEKKMGRVADWFLWVEDDVSVPQDIFKTLRESADPKARPFVCAPGHTRNPPFYPTVWEIRNGAYTRWDDVPESGVYEVCATGLVAALFHRSLFNRVPQPWFAVTSNKLGLDADGLADVDRGMKPDSWWAEQLRAAGIPVFINCNVDVTHFGMPLPVNRKTARTLRNLEFLKDWPAFERTVRGEPTRDSGALHPRVRSGVSEGLAVADSGGGGTRQVAAQGEPSVLQGQGASPAPRAELPVQFRIVDDPAIWRGGGDSPWWQESGLGAVGGA